MSDHPRERLSAWLDGELDAEDRAVVERHLQVCTECTREAAILRHLGGAMRNAGEREATHSVWTGVHHSITRPVGWLLLMAGLGTWAGLAVWEWWRADITLEWLAGSGAVIGAVFLIVGIGHEQYRDWKDTRYKDVEL